MKSATLFQLIVALKRRCSATEENIQRELGISPGEFNGLLALEPGETVRGAEFAERLGLSVSRGSRVSGMLAARGWAVVETTASDRRSVFIGLSKQGIAVRRKLRRKLQGCEDRLMASFSGTEVDHIRSALTMLQQAL
jgi:DNA-binding MarR family transcriptional regulator